MIKVDCEDDDCDWGPKTFYAPQLAKTRRMVHMNETGHKTSIRKEAS